MRTLLFGLVFLSPPWLKKILLRWLGAAKIGAHAEIGWFSAVMARRIELDEHAIIRPFTLIKLDGDLRVGAYSEISSFNLIYGSSDLSIGASDYIGPQCLINVEEKVSLGDQSALGPRSMIFTHGSFLPYTEGYWVKLASVTIGNHVWCAAGVFIHPGVEIGDDTFVNSMSVVTQPIPPGSIAEGNPAQVVYPMERIKRKMSPARGDIAARQMLSQFVEIGLRRELGLTEIHEEEARVCFRWKGKTWQIALVASNGTAPPSGEPPDGVERIWIVNHPGWSPSSQRMIFDLTTLETRYSSDPIHTRLRLFLQRYYGVRFRDAK